MRPKLYGFWFYFYFYYSSFLKISILLGRHLWMCFWSSKTINNETGMKRVILLPSLSTVTLLASRIIRHFLQCVKRGWFSFLRFFQLKTKRFRTHEVMGFFSAFEFLWSRSPNRNQDSVYWEGKMTVRGGCQPMIPWTWPFFVPALRVCPFWKTFREGRQMV